MDDHPLASLIGRNLPNGWVVEAFINPKPGATGGYFSHGFSVRNADGRVAFLKALDYTRAFDNDDPPTALKELTEAFIFERDLCLKCHDKNLRRVVQAIDHGSIRDPALPFNTVEYLIFEMADGDVRAHLDAMAVFDLALILRFIHHVATGMRQLHGTGIAHQDLKPSNVLIFSGNSAKVADLGRASAKGILSPHDGLGVPGAITHAPPELLAGLTLTSWNDRVACDLYHLGSLIVFLFMRTTVTALIKEGLASLGEWYSEGMIFEEIMPYLTDAFGKSLTVISETLPHTVNKDLTLLVSYLCDPNPQSRGHPLNRRPNQNRYGLERFITRLDVLATRAEYRLRESL